MLLYVFLLANYPDNTAKAKAGDANITSLYRYCRILLTAAHSPRLSAVFESDFFVHKYLLFQLYPFRLQALIRAETDDEWQRIRDAMYQIADMESTSLIEEDNPKLPNKMAVLPDLLYGFRLEL